MNTRAIIVCALSACATIGCAPKTIAAVVEAPLTDPTDAIQLSEADLASVHTLIAEFLAARWSYDSDKTQPMLSAVDREEMKASIFVPPSKYVQTSIGPKAAPGQHHSWRVGETQAIGADAAWVDVRLARPTLASLLLNNMRQTVAATRLGAHGVQAMLAGEIDGPVPDRQVVDVRYKVVREADGWRVFMGWSAEKEQIDSGQFDPTTFGGSEAAITILAAELKEQQTQKTERAPRELVNAVKAAEALVQDERFDEAIDAYTPLSQHPDVPDFVGERIPYIARRRESRAEQQVGLDSIKFKWGKPRMGDHFWEVPVKVTNTGKVGYKSLSVTIEPKPGKTDSFQMAGGIGAGESDEKILRMPFVDERPKIKRMSIARAFPEDPAVAERFADEKSQFHEQLNVWQTGRARQPTVPEDGRQIRKLADDLRACEGFGEESVELTVSIDANGALAAYEPWTAEQSDALKTCITEVLGAHKYRAGRARTSLVEISPPRKRYRPNRK